MSTSVVYLVSESDYDLYQVISAHDKKEDAEKVIALYRALKIYYDLEEIVKTNFDETPVIFYKYSYRLETDTFSNHGTCIADGRNVKTLDFDAQYEYVTILAETQEELDERTNNIQNQIRDVMGEKCPHKNKKSNTDDLLYKECRVGYQWCYRTTKRYK
jgi:hypothetical protein